MRFSFFKRSPVAAGFRSTATARQHKRLNARRTAKQTFRPGLDPLEDRRLLAITPGQLYTDASFTDADGDTVRVQVSGAASSAQGFTVELAGLATDHADATRINLVGLTAVHGLQIVVTPTELSTSAGLGFNRIYSAGYTNVGFVSALSDSAHPASPIAALGGIQLSAAVVNSISLPGVAVGNISLDAGQAPFIDRINTTNNQQAADSTMYNPVTGLIDLGGIEAGSIDSLVINGAISAPTANPYDISVTNDFRSVINVSGAIGTVVGLRSSLSGAIRAASIGSVRVAAIAGEITTRNTAEAFSINLPANFKGFINSAGHLNLGFPLSDGALITGQIEAGGGISGSDKVSTTDPILVPAGYLGSLSNTSPVAGIASIAIDGVGQLGVSSASSIGNISADGFTGDFVVQAGTSIGSIDAGSGTLEGHLQAGTSIGNLKAVRNILGTIIAGGSLGSITTVEGNLESLSIIAGGDVGPLSLYQGMLGTSIVAGGNLGPISIPAGGISLSYLRGTDIGPITVTDGSIETTSIVATRDLASISTFGSIAGFGISDTSLVAGRNIGSILGQAHTGFGIELLKVEAGGSIASISGISYGEFGVLAGAGISQSNVVAADIGAVLGRSVGGSGIEATRIITRTVSGTATGRIASIEGHGWQDGLLDVVAVAHTDIGSISGVSLVTGSGIRNGSFDANYGSIGQITAAAGADGGDGIFGTRFQASDEASGGILGITTSANANGFDAMNGATVYGRQIGAIVATVHGGLNGNGIVAGEIRAFSGPIDSITVDVRSINGIGIQDGLISASGDISRITVKTFNNSAILGGDFQSRGNFGAIYAESVKGGNAIENAIFSAPGRIFFAPQEDEDPRGSFGTITAIAGGTSALSNAILDSTFTAIGDIGLITASSKGAGGIIGSTFTADSDGNYDPAAVSAGQRTGTIAGITVVAAGRQLLASSGIVDSIFIAAGIGTISVDVQTVEGGDGISRSTFTARTAVYDGVGNFNNTGTIGDIVVKNAADQLGTGNGITSGNFFAGAAGGIGNIRVTTASGSGIILSLFDASILTPDLDQGLYSSTIGTITVQTGRVANSTFLPAGITLSNFSSAAGIGNIAVDSIGSGITLSNFVADFDWTLNSNVRGDIGDITVRVPGRSASGVTASTFFGSSIGNITVRLTDNAAQGINAVAFSAFTAWNGTIGNVAILHSQTGFIYTTLGVGYAVLTSAFTATVGIGSVTIQGRTLGAVFIVSGAPVVRVARSAGPAATSIGPVNITPDGSTDISFETTSTMGPLSFVDAPAGTIITLKLAASAVGNIVVNALGSLNVADLNLTAKVLALGNLDVDGNLTMTASTAQSIGAITAGGNAVVNAPVATTLGHVTAGGNATLTTPAATMIGNLSVGGMLSLPQGLPNLVQMGSFTVGSLEKVAKNVQIGAKTVAGTTIGAIQIGAANKGKGRYVFAFAGYAGNPNATVAGKAVNAATGNGRVVNGVQFIRTTVKAPTKKLAAAPKKK